MQPHPLDPHSEVRLVPVSPRVTLAYGPVTGVFHGAFPLVRTNLENWFAGLDRLAAWAPRVVIPGHGPVAGPEVLDDQRRLLEALATEVGDLLRAGASVDEAVARVRMDAYRDLPLAGERLPLAVRGAAIALGYGEASRDA